MWAGLLARCPACGCVDGGAHIPSAWWIEPGGSHARMRTEPQLVSCSVVYGGSCSDWRRPEVATGGDRVPSCVLYCTPVARLPQPRAATSSAKLNVSTATEPSRENIVAKIKSRAGQAAAARAADDELCASSTGAPGLHSGRRLEPATSEAKHSRRGRLGGRDAFCFGERPLLDLDLGSMCCGASPLRDRMEVPTGGDDSRQGCTVTGRWCVYG